eukprot:sb/3478658/
MPINWEINKTTTRHGVFQAVFLCISSLLTGTIITRQYKRTTHTHTHNNIDTACENKTQISLYPSGSRGRDRSTLSYNPYSMRRKMVVVPSFRCSTKSGP